MSKLTFFPSPFSTMSNSVASVRLEPSFSIRDINERFFPILNASSSCVRFSFSRSLLIFIPIRSVSNSLSSLSLLFVPFFP